MICNRTRRSRARIELRRCRQPLPHTKLLYLKRPDRVAEPLELEIASGVPGICSNHGRTAVRLRPFRTQFFDTRQHPRSARSFAAGRNLNTIPPVSTVLVGAWPVCARCEHSARWLRRCGVVLLWVMAAIFAAFLLVIAAGWMGAKVPVAVAMALVCAFFPGSLPIGMVVAVWCFKKCGEPAKFQCIDDDLRLNVEAHPDFCAALQATPGQDGASHAAETN